MKKRIFALALALCMMLAVMPNSFAAGILSVGDGTSTDTTVPSGGSILSVGGNTSTQLSNTGALQNSILSNGSSAGQTDYEFGTATDQSQTSMTINTGSSSNEQDTTTDNTADQKPTASDRLAAVTPVTPNKEQLTVSKTISETLQDDENNPYYKIDLAAKAISNIVVETKASAIDVILILDRSGNMTAMSDLITAINGNGTEENKGFLDTVKATAENSRVAVVTYAGENASAVISGTNNISNGAFVKLSDTDNYNALRQEISELTAVSGADAYSNKGFEKAARLFQSIPSTNENYNNPRIVVFFTAGIPGKYGKSWEDYETKESGRGESSRVYHAYNIAQESIHWSVILKAPKTNPTTTVNLNLSQQFWTWYSYYEDHGDSRTSESVFYVEDEYDYRIGCGATVYCVGLNLIGCNHSSHGRYSAQRNCSGTRTNEYLYRISSHRPDGSHVGNMKITANTWEYALDSWESTYPDQYTRNLKKNYSSAPASYYQVGKIDEISGMFNEIKVDVEQNKPISDVVMRDYLAPGFVPCDSKGTVLSVGQTITTDGYVGTVEQEGDVYYIKWAATTLEPGEDGKDEINASIYVKPVYNLGGRDTKTNIYGPSGLYSDDTLFASFPAPDVDVPVKEIVPNAQSFTIYLSNAADLANLVKLDDRLDGKKNAGVTVTYTIMDGGNEVASYKVAKGAVATEFPSEIVKDLQTCKTYTVVCTVDGGAESDADTTYRKVSEKAGTVHVVQPQLTFADVNVYLGKTPVFDAEPELTWVTTSPTSGHTCGTPAGKVPDIECTFKYNKAHYLKDTTVTPTANLTGTSGNTYQVVQNDFKVSVYAPVVTYQDTTIYLSENANFEMDSGETATANLVSTAWEHEGTAAPAAMGAAPTLKFNYSVGESGLTACADVFVTAVGIDEDEGMIVGETTYSYVDFTTFKKGSQETDATQFTVHVVKPVITSNSTTIYLGNTIELKGQMNEGLQWTCADKSLDAPTDSKLDVIYDFKKVNQDDGTLSTIPALDSYDPSDCTTVAVSATVNGKPAPIENAYQRFTVHVLKPTVTFQDSEIFLSESADYADNLVLVGDNEEQASWACSDDEGSTEEAPPTLIYEYSVKAQDFKVCTPVNITKVYSDKDKSNTITANDADITSGVTFMNGRDDRTRSTEKFKVHVYRPQIVMTSRPLWNDYNKAAKYEDLVQAVESASIGKWLDECKANAEKAVNSTEITMSEPTYTFKLGEEEIGEDGYKAATYHTTDFDTLTVALNSVKIGGKLYQSDELPEVATKAFDINVNKFDLTIKKTWSGADVYKQDAIFTVSGGLGEFQVVLPKGESNVIVTGLLCGQDYTVTEDDAWTWRWEATKDISFTTHEHDVSTSAPTEHINLGQTEKEDTTSVSFTNNLIEKLGELWLSFCTTVKNIFAAITTTEGGN